MSGGSPPSREPNWNKWRLIPEVKVWQAVALSLDIDPDMVRRNPNTWMSTETAFREGRDFKDRFDIACANVGRGHALTPVMYPSGHKGGYPVRVREFATWCLSIDWNIPDGLRALARPSTNTTTLRQSPVTDAPSPLEALPPRDAPKPSEGTHRPSNAGTVGSAPATAADKYFSEQNARQAAKVASFANEAGYAQLVASVDAKDLHLNLAPDWPHWANMTYVIVSDAACLSLGISPEARLPQINLSDVRKRVQEFNVAGARVQLGLAALEQAQRIIQQRLEQAMSAIEAGQLPSARRSLNQILGLTPSPASVRLPRYRLWAESLPEPYVFPEGFPPAEPHSEPLVYSSAQPEQPGTDHERPMGKRERDTLLTIVAALAKELSIDVSQPSKAAAAIEKLTTKVGARIAQRTIENHLKRIPEALDSKSD